MKNDEFYIGWMEKAPSSFVKHVKRAILILIGLVILTGISIAILQKKFSTGSFEFGKLTEVSGIYMSKPIPSLKVIAGRNIVGSLTYITVPLIGTGKFGADKLIDEVEKTRAVSLNGKEVAFKGTLLYNDGRLLMQIDDKDNFLLKTGEAADSSLLPIASDLGQQTISGEIVDPKCFFGVMKPGEGKPHKDCAIRCILGGMPPVLKVTASDGSQSYYLIVGENGEKINNEIKNFIAEPVTIRARAVKHDDWVVLYVKQNGVSSYSYIKQHFGNAIASCTPGCAK